MESDEERCLFCLQTEEEGFDLLRGVVRLPCCHKYAHRACQAWWENENLLCSLSQRISGGGRDSQHCRSHPASSRPCHRGAAPRPKRHSHPSSECHL